MHCFPNAWHDERQHACCRCSCFACVACFFCVCCFCCAPFCFSSDRLFFLSSVPSWGSRGRPGPLWVRARRPWSSDFRPSIITTCAPDLLRSGAGQEWAVALPRIVEIKERVANVSAYDPIYALAWVEIPGGTRYEDLADECKYGMLENECNSAFRDCIKSIALKNKVQTETERMHTISRRLGSRQILWLHYDFLRPHVTGDSTFKLIDLVKTTIDRFTHGTEQERLEAFTIRWDHVLAGISVDRPDVKMLCALFYEQVREFRCLELDMQLWDRDESVRSYAYLRTICDNAITTWHRRRNQEKMYSASRSTSAQRRYAAPAHGSPRRSIAPDPNEVRGRLDVGTPDVAARIVRRLRSSPRRGSPRLSSRSPGRAPPAPSRGLPFRSPRGSQICYDFKLGRCNRGSGCKFSHNLKGRSSSPKGFAPRSKSPMESGICFYYAKGSCTRGNKCPYKHIKPNAPAQSTNIAAPAPAEPAASTRRVDSPAPTPADF